MKPSNRTFSDEPAVRRAVPLLIGLSGSSGAGKTYSALRLATGMQRVSGGEIFMIDTESRRGLHYADAFRFRHVNFEPPFSPLDYLAAIEHCVERGAKTIIIDSMSHEHEGPGGVLEMHEQEVQRMSGGDPKKAQRVKFGAWAKPKAQRRRLINSILQTGVNAIMCFRAKEKLRPRPGKEPEPLGWMPIAGSEYVYECALAAILPPGSNGTPDWGNQKAWDAGMMKSPSFFEWMRDISHPLDEATGERMAAWAAGTTADDNALVEKIRSAVTPTDLEKLIPDLKTATNKDVLRAAYKSRMEKLTAEVTPDQIAGPPEDA